MRGPCEASLADLRLIIFDLRGHHASALNRICWDHFEHIGAEHGCKVEADLVKIGQALTAAELRN